MHGRDAADKLSLMQHADPFRLQYSAWLNNTWPYLDFHCGYTVHDVEIGKSPVSVCVCACVFSISVTSLLLRSKSECDAAHSRASLEGVGGVGRTPNTVCAPTFFFHSGEPRVSAPRAHVQHVHLQGWVCHTKMQRFEVRGRFDWIYQFREYRGQSCKLNYQT